MQIRKIEQKDNQAIGNIVQKVLVELGAPKVGTAYADPNLFNLFETYNKPNAAYFVVENNDKIIGGAGIAALDETDDNICELQKMYFLKEARGTGMGNALIDVCLQAATQMGYKQCYLETMPYMLAAQRLYVKKGFTYIAAPLGNTGHTACPVYMIKDL